MKKTLIWIIPIIIVIGVVVGTILLLNNSNNSINNYDYEKIIGKSFTMADNSYIVFKDNKRGIGQLPEHKSRIFLSLKLILTKLGSKTLSSENLK